MKDDAEFAARMAENFERVNDDHMPPDSPAQDILSGLSKVLIGLIVVLIVALALAQLAK